MELTTQQYIDFMNRINELERKVNKSDFSEVLDGQTRYKLEYAGRTVSFSATKAETREQLAEVLEEFIGMLRAPEDTGEVGFF